MRVFALSDQTIRVPRRHVGPTRELPRQFAPARPRRWPYLVVALLALLAVVAVAVALRVMHQIDRSAEAQELLRLLGR